MFRRTNALMAPALLALAMPLAACGDDPVRPVTEMDITETAAAAGAFQTLLTAVEAAGLTETLRGAGPFTVFAPTDAAFAALPAGTVEALLADTEALTEILLYHVVPGRILAGDLADGQIVTTAGGREFRVTLTGGARVNDVNIVQTDVMASNGVIHVIDGVLLPVEDNVGMAVQAGFNTLVAAVEAAELVDVLRTGGPFTIFAPTDEAFGALPAGALESLLADPAALATVLTYHVVPGRLFAADLADGMQLTTVEGRALTVSLGDGARVNGVGITAVDVFTANGVIHVIDGVLLPGS
jgi:transforming growth factor-beta-induced protein